MQRYEMEVTYGYAEPKPSESGDYVIFDDHAAEVHRLNNDLTKLTLENQALKRDIARVLAALAEYVAPEEKHRGNQLAAG